MINTETKIESYRMSTIIVMYDLQTQFLHNAIDGVTDVDASSRLETRANNMVWLTGSLVQARYELAEKLDENAAEGQNIGKTAGHQLFKEGKGIQENVTYPALSTLLKDWDRISPILRDILADVDEQKLNNHLKMNGKTMSYFDLIAFNTYREANIIGQLALWRRLLGYEPMKYD